MFVRSICRQDPPKHFPSRTYPEARSRERSSERSSQKVPQDRLLFLWQPENALKRTIVKRTIVRTILRTFLRTILYRPVARTFPGRPRSLARVFMSVGRSCLTVTRKRPAFLSCEKQQRCIRNIFSCEYADLFVVWDMQFLNKQ